MLIRQVEVCRMIRKPTPIQPFSRWPGMAESFHTQSPDLGPRAVPYLFPRPVMHFAHTIRLHQLARIRPLRATVPLRPLPPPYPDIWLRPKATLLDRPSVEGRDSVLYAVNMKYRRRPRRVTSVECTRALVQRGRDGGECRDGRGRVLPTAKQRRKATAVRLATGINAGLVNAISGGDSIDHIVDVSDVIDGLVLIGGAFPDVLHGPVCVVHALAVSGEEWLASDSEGRVRKLGDKLLAGAIAAC